MPEPLSPRFEDGPAMLLAGVRATHTFGTSDEGIPAQWAKLYRLGLLPGPLENVAYGVVSGSDSHRGTFDYMAAVEVEEPDPTLEGADWFDLPAARYAVFTHEGSGEHLKSTYATIFGQWMPKSGYRTAGTPHFERYGPNYDPKGMIGDIEVWVAVEPDA